MLHFFRIFSIIREVKPWRNQKDQLHSDRLSSAD